MKANQAFPKLSIISWLLWRCLTVKNSLAKSCYLFNLLEYLRKFLINCQTASLDVSTEVPSGAQTVLSEEHRERLQRLKHFLDTHTHKVLMLILTVCAELRLCIITASNPLTILTDSIHMPVHDFGLTVSNG